MRLSFVVAVLVLVGGCAVSTPPAPEVERCPVELRAWEEAGFSGVVVMATRGSVDCVAGYGLADREARVPNTADTVFDIGSVTKSFTAAAIFSLLDDGKVALDAPVRQYLPELTGPVGDATIRQLLLHTSGLNGTHGGDYEPMSPDAALTAINNLELAFPPGQEYLYANSGYTTLALVVERLAGYRDLMAARILPEGAGFWNGEPAPRGPRAVGYLEGGGVGAGSDFGGPFWGMEGNGGLAMTMPELASWTYELFTGQVVSPASTEVIASPGVETGDGQAETPGWGAVDESVYGTPMFAAAGGGGTGHNVVVVWLPEQERVVALASNGFEVTAEDLLEEIGPALAADESLPRPPDRDSAVDAEAIVGRYTLDTGGSYDVTVDDGLPVVAATGADAVVALFGRQEGFDEHEDLVRALLDGRTQEGLAERARFEEITGITVVGTVEQDGEVRTYVTVAAGGREVFGWYALNAYGGVEAAEFPSPPPSLGLVPDGDEFQGDDVTVAFGDGELTITGPGGTTTARAS